MNIKLKYIYSSLRSSLFSEESKYEFYNSNFVDITTNSKSMIGIIYNSLSLNGCNFENILLNGDSDDSSLITFISGDNENSVIIKNTSFKNCQSNGDLLVINGNNTFIEIDNIILNNISSYGSLLNDLSLNVSNFLLL